MRVTTADSLEFKKFITSLVKRIAAGGDDAQDAFEHYKLFRKDEDELQLGIEADFLNALAAQPDLSRCGQDVLLEAARIYRRNDGFKKPEEFLTHLENSANRSLPILHMAYLQTPEKLHRDELLKQIFDQSTDLAAAGDTVAQYNLALMYVKGRGVAQDDVEAVKWYQKAADRGHAYSQFCLGVMYYKGRGVAQDDLEAVKWYRKAAEQGHALAQYNLGVMYEKGRGVAQDNAEAVKWYQKAADQGDAQAQSNLGVMYEKGRGVAQDDLEAVKWYRKAAEQGSALAQYNLGFMYEKGRGVAQDGLEAVKWLQKAADQGDAYSQFCLGVMYYKGRGVAQDDLEAVKWNRKAADQGHAYSQFCLGVMYEKGRGVAQDDLEAVKWYQKAADQGYAQAQSNLGVMYYKGRGISTERQPDKEIFAAFWFEKAAEQGNKSAVKSLKALKLDKRQQKIKPLMLERGLNYRQASQFIDNSDLRNALLFNLQAMQGDSESSFFLPTELLVLILSYLSPLSDAELLDLKDKTTGFFLYKNRTMRTLENFLKNQSLSALTAEYHQADALLTEVRSTGGEVELFFLLDEFLKRPVSISSIGIRLWRVVGGFNSNALCQQLEGVYKALQKRLSVDLDSDGFEHARLGGS